MIGTYNTIVALSTMNAPSIDELASMVKDMEAKRKEVDAGMAKALRDHMNANSLTLFALAGTLNAQPSFLFDVLYAEIAIPAWLWGNIEWAFRHNAEKGWLSTGPTE